MLWQQFDKHFSKKDPVCLSISPGYTYAEEAKKEDLRISYLCSHVMLYIYMCVNIVYEYKI